MARPSGTREAREVVKMSKKITVEFDEEEFFNMAAAVKATATFIDFPNVYGKNDNQRIKEFCKQEGKLVKAANKMLDSIIYKGGK